MLQLCFPNYARPKPSFQQTIQDQKTLTTLQDVGIADQQKAGEKKNDGIVLFMSLLLEAGACLS